MTAIFIGPVSGEERNNHVERALRSLVLGLKNWLFVYQDLGGERAAIILTVLGTCVAQRINPRAFLHKALGLIVRGLPDDQLPDLLPDRLAERFPELRMPARGSPGPDEQSLAQQIAELEDALAEARALLAAPQAEPAAAAASAPMLTGG